MVKILTSWDDGNKLDMKLAELLKKYELPAIFFIPNSCELDDHEIIDLSKSFTIGGHTFSHPNDMKTLSNTDALKELTENKNWLEWMIGRTINWFCYPSGRYSESTIQVVKMAGFKYARTTLVGNVTIADNPYRVATSVHAYPHRKEYNGQNWLEYAKERFDEAEDLGGQGLFHVWGHSWEVDKFNLWVELEELFKYISKNL